MGSIAPTPPCMQKLAHMQKLSRSARSLALLVTLIALRAKGAALMGEGGETSRLSRGCVTKVKRASALARRVGRGPFGAR